MAAACDIRVLKLVGHLSREVLDEALVGLGEAWTVTDLIVDASGMTGYDGAARQRFVEWNAQNREHVRRLAIVTDNGLWRMVIRAMALASGREMKPFTEQVSATKWLEEPA